VKTAFDGKRNKRGDWQPDEPLSYAPVFVWPFKPMAFLKWVFGYPGFFFPWGVIYMAVPIITWAYFTPALESMKTFAIDWIAYIFIRNLILIFLVAGAWHLWLYVKQAQGTDWKYTTKWLAQDNPIFMFRNQLYDNIFWTVVSAVPIWTAYEVVTMWGYANGYFPYVSPQEHPIYFVVMMCLIPIFRELHFYSIHRISHWGPLYKYAHYLHHNNVNVGPFTGLSMHPIEHLLYFSGVLIHWVIPSHPIHAIFHLQHAAITPAQSHSGFERVVLTDDFAVQTGDMFHNLHHKYFECNYGADGPLPLDKMFGTFHDGTKEAQTRMDERFLARAAQKAAAESEGK
jgi:sterol desaturase/sphingolipid hydroxylase (fatty acid hydroxylase superfamily)